MEKIKNLYLWEVPNDSPPKLFIRYENGDEEIKRGFKPYFYVKARRSQLRSWIDNFPVKRVDCDSIIQLENLVRRHSWTGEANIPYLIRYAVDSDLQYTSNRKVMYLDIEVGEPGKGSLDTENCPDPITLITIKEKEKPLLTFAYGYEGEHTITFDDEQNMLRAFMKYISNTRPDIIAGWNIISYDIPYLEGRLQKHGLPTFMYSYRQQTHFHGTQSFDLLLLYKEYFEMGGRASLANVAKLIGEEKKIPTDDFVKYNQWDVVLCEKIDKFYGIIDLMTTFQELAPIHISDLHRSILIDTYILKKANQKGIILPTHSPFKDSNEKLHGAEVLETRKGVFTNVVFYDIRSAYPNILLHKRIAHEGSEDSLFLEVLNEIYQTRLKWRALKKQNPYDEKLKLWDKAFKFLLNAQTGQLGFSNSRYYAPHLFNRMTGEVRRAIKLVKEEFGDTVLAGDSVVGDSLIVIRENKGKPKIIEIQELFKDGPDYKIGEKEYKQVEGIETITFCDWRVVWRPIKHVMRHRIYKEIYRLKLSDIWHLDVTEDHSVYTSRYYPEVRVVRPTEMKKGDKIILPFTPVIGGPGIWGYCDTLEVIDIEKKEYDGYVYDLEVEDTHNFFANWILVHNTDSCIFTYKESPDELLDRLNELMNEHDIPLEFEVDKVLRKIVFLGKKKNYFGIDENGKLIYAGMYASQTSCPLFCKRALEEAMVKILSGATLSEINAFLQEKQKEINNCDLDDLVEEKMTRKGKEVSFNYKAWEAHLKQFGEAPPLPSKLSLLPLRTGKWMILTEKSRKFCEREVDRKAIFNKWIGKPVRGILKEVYNIQKTLF